MSYHYVSIKIDFLTNIRFFWQRANEEGKVLSSRIYKEMRKDVNRPFSEGEANKHRRSVLEAVRKWGSKL